MTGRHPRSPAWHALVASMLTDRDDERLEAHYRWVAAMVDQHMLWETLHAEEAKRRRLAKTKRQRGRAA